MRIERIRVDAFGRLTDFDTGAEPLGGLVIVLGPNEAGKSTLFNFLTTALYGFHPASRERNPHVPWGTEEAKGRIQFSFAGDGCAEVERRLRSSPATRLRESGVIKELRNQPLPWVDHVPRGVFRQVFAVTLADLAALDEDTWGHIQDRIVGSMGTSDMRSARLVADALEKEASEIWRPNRRGNQTLRAVQEEIRALRSRRTEALERDRTIRSLVEERENVQVRLREVRADRATNRVSLERVQTLQPLRAQLDRVRTLRARGGAREELELLPPDPAAELQRLRAEADRVDRENASLFEHLAEPEEVIGRFDSEAKRLIEHRDEILNFTSLAASADPDRRRVAELEAELGDLRIKIESTAEHLLENGWSDTLSSELRALPLALVKDRIERVRATSTPSNAAAPRATPRARIAAALAGLAVGVGLLAWGIAGGPAAAVAAGAALATAAVIALLLGSRDLGRAELTDPSESDSFVGVESVQQLLERIPVRADYLTPPGAPLLSGLERLQELSESIRERTAALERSAQTVAASDEAAKGLSASLGREPEVPEGFAQTIDRELREAERLQEAARGAERERSRIARALEEGRTEARLAHERVESLVSSLSKMGGVDADADCAEARARIEAHRRADEIEEELERSHGSLEQVASRIEAAERDSGAWAMEDAQLARLRSHVEEQESQIEGLIAEAEKLDRDAAHLRDLETVDGVDSEIANLQEAETRLVKERDRRWVLSQLVREADRRFREEHQPDLIRRASEHLNRLTGGRYDRILVDETRSDEPFLLMGSSLPAPVPLRPPVSTGTLEQAYLSLRLAIVDHLDHGTERIPLFIDEAFVNWDRERREQGLDVLAEISKTRQLFIFTCHPAMAAEIEGRGGRTIRLERGA